MKTILTTERLILREMSHGDLDFVAEMLGDEEVMRHYPKQYNRQESAAWIQRGLDRYVRDGYGLWLVLDRATNEPRGQVGLLVQKVDGVVEDEIGYLIHRPYWRLGLASEAATAVRDWAFDVQGKSRLISLIRPANLPSQAVARKIGMKPEKRALHAGTEHIVFARGKT